MLLLNADKSISFSILKLLRAAVSYSPMSTSVITCDEFHIWDMRRDKF